MTRTRPPNRLLDNLISLISFPAFRLLEGLQNSRTKSYLSDRHFSFPQYQRTLFIQLTYSCFPVTIFPPIAWLHFSADKYTRNSQLLQPLWRRANAQNFSFSFKLFKMMMILYAFSSFFQSRFDFSYYLSYLKYIIVNNMFSNSNLFCYW